MAISLFCSTVNGLFFIRSLLFLCVHAYVCVKALRASAECFNPPFGVLNMNVIECPS